MADASTPPRAMPHDIQAEMGVLGSMLLSRDAVFLARERLNGNSFYNLANQDVFGAILHLADARDAVDLILLRDELKRQDRLAKVGGVAYLQQLMEAVPTSANVEYYVEIVHEHAVRRHLIETATAILKSSYEDSQDVDTLLDDAETRMLAVRNLKQSGHVRDMDGVLLDIMTRLEQVHQNPGMITGVPTGFNDLDDLTNGFQPGELVVVAARPSVGKTTLALNMLHNLCHIERRPAVLYTLEMRAEQIVSNLLCIHNRLDTQDFRRGTLRDTEWQAIEDSIDDLREWPLYIDDTPSLAIGDLRARARRMRHEHKVELIVVDYMQLVRPGRARDSRAVEVAEISAGLKALARELEIPVIAVAQLNRAVEREDRRPRMSDLRESGAIEQDADVILLLHRPDKEDEGGDDSDGDGRDRPRSATGNMPGANSDVIVAKQRNGPTGVCHLLFWKRYLRFESRASHANI